jgi:hypothetical protein
MDIRIRVCRSVASGQQTNTHKPVRHTRAQHSNMHYTTCCCCRWCMLQVWPRVRGPLPCLTRERGPLPCLTRAASFFSPSRPRMLLGCAARCSRRCSSALMACYRCRVVLAEPRSWTSWARSLVVCKLALSRVPLPESLRLAASPC